MGFWGEKGERGGKGGGRKERKGGANVSNVSTRLYLISLKPIGEKKRKKKGGEKEGTLRDPSLFRISQSAPEEGEKKKKRLLKKKKGGGDKSWRLLRIRC